MIRYTLLLLLAGCITTPDAIVPPTERTVHVDPRILELCEPLEKLPDTSTFEDLLAITITNFELYSECATKQKVSATLLKRFANRGGK